MVDMDPEEALVRILMPYRGAGRVRTSCGADAQRAPLDPVEVEPFPRSNRSRMNTEKRRLRVARLFAPS